MPYRYLDDIATADVAFEAWGDTREDLFVAAGDATMNAMLEDLGTLAPQQRRSIELESDALDLLLFQLLQELIYYKDAECLLLRVRDVVIDQRGDTFRLAAQAFGEEIDREKHELIVDVKAVTLHHFRVEQSPRGWEAAVILDV